LRQTAVVHNMKKNLRQTLTIGILLIGITVFGQEYGFDIHNTSLDEYIQIEKKLKSEKTLNTTNYVSFNGDAQPIKFKRKEKDIPDLMVSYHFKEKDSTMSSILYEWDVSNFEKKDNNQKSAKFQKALVKKYNALEKMINEHFGEAKIEGDLSDLSRTDKKDGRLNKKNIWQPNDSTEIVMYTAISNFYEKNGMVTTNPTHRIRLYIKNTKKDEKLIDKLDEKRVDSLNVLSKNFLLTLETKDLLKSKDYLSDLIKETVTDEQLNALIENLNFESETELIYSGVQVGLDGSVFTLLHYKYENDTSQPPKELIKIIFDDKNKIVGIQPIKLQGKVKD